LSSDFEENDFGIFSYFGVTDPHKLKILTQFIRDMRPHATVIVHRDRDFMTDDEVSAWRERVREMKLQPYVTEGRDVEDAFVNAVHLADLNGSITEIEAGALISGALEELRPDAIKNFVNGRIEILRKSGVTNPNMGEIAEVAAQNVAADLRKCVKGKTLLARARARFKAEKGVNLKVGGTSAAIASDDLRKIRKLQK
jgi:hypothetical protein